MSDGKRVLVTGATGQQSGSVARRLLEQGDRVRGITRNVDSDAAKELVARGAEVVRAELTDADSLAAALEDIDAVFAMTTPFRGRGRGGDRSGRHSHRCRYRRGCGALCLLLCRFGGSGHRYRPFRQQVSCRGALGVERSGVDGDRASLFHGQPLLPRHARRAEEGRIRYRAAGRSPTPADCGRRHRCVRGTRLGPPEGIRRKADRYCGRRAHLARECRHTVGRARQASGRRRSANRCDPFLEPGPCRDV